MGLPGHFLFAKWHNLSVSVTNIISTRGAPWNSVEGLWGSQPTEYEVWN